MYNKYMGNTGKFIRVEDHQGGAPSAHRPGVNPPPVHQPAHQEFVEPPVSHTPDPTPAAIKNKPHHGGLGGGLNNLFGGLGGGLNNLLGGHGGGLSNLLGGHGGKNSDGILSGLGNGLKGLTGVFDHLPFGLDLGDILLFVMLLFLFKESGDEEFIIILAVLAFSLFKER